MCPVRQAHHKTGDKFPVQLSWKQTAPSILKPRTRKVQTQPSLSRQGLWIYAEKEQSFVFLLVIVLALKSPKCIWSKHNHLSPWRLICATLKRLAEYPKSHICRPCATEAISTPLPCTQVVSLLARSIPSVNGRRVGKPHTESSQIAIYAVLTLCQKPGERFYSRYKLHYLGLSQLKCLMRNCLLPIS